MSTPEHNPDVFESLGKMKMPNFKALLASKPNNIVSGAIAGIGNTLGGAVIAIAIMVGSPIRGGLQGYSAAGAKGCAGGVLTGVLLGAVAGAAVAAVGAISCIWQVTFGLIRTPAAMMAYCLGKDWDADTEEFVAYDLTEDSSNTLSYSDETLKEALIEKGSLAKVLRVKNVKPGVVVEKRRKHVKETALYDLLEIEPEATQAEIKKAYYIKARKNHPDRNPQDEKAHATFQMIGEAYQVLSDERLRQAYDTRGKVVVKKTEVDAAAIYAILFGSELFESIIGELQSATHVKAMIDPASDNSTDFLAFKQRRREVQLAVNLVAKMASYMEGDAAIFTERCEAEAEELSASPLGGALLALIGGIYKDRSTIEASHIAGYTVSVRQTGEAVSDLVSVAVNVTKMAYGFLEMQKIHQQNQAMLSLEDDRLGVPREARPDRSTTDLLKLFTPDSGADQTLMRPLVKNLSEHILGVTWQVLKSDVMATLSGVCNKALHDRSASKELLRKRREALFILGHEYYKKSASIDSGLSDLVDRMGLQTGLYGPMAGEAAAAAAAAAEANGKQAGDENEEEKEENDESKFYDEDSEEEGEFHHTNGDFTGTGTSYYQEGNPEDYKTVKEILPNLKTFSVKELKEKIIFYGKKNEKESNNFIEKAEIRKYLKGILLSKLRIEDLRILLGNEMKDENIEEKSPSKSGGFSSVSFQDVINDCDKDTIITMLLKSKSN